MKFLERLRERLRRRPRSSTETPSSISITSSINQGGQRDIAGRSIAVAGNIPPIKTTPMAIPELLERIFSFLGQLYLRTTVPLVCKQWSDVVRPLVLRRLYWNPEWFPFECLVLNETSTPSSHGENYHRRILPKLGSVQILQCQLVQKPVVASLGTRVGLFDLWDPIVKENLWKEFLHRVQDLTKEYKSWGIQELDLFETMDPKTKILPLLNCLPNLTRLRLENVMTMGSLPLGWILEASPGLQSLEILDSLRSALQPNMIGSLVDGGGTRPDRMDSTHGGNERQISGLIPTRLRLRQLRLQQVRLTADLLQRLLKASPELQTLGLLFLTCETLAASELEGNLASVSVGEDDGRFSTVGRRTWKGLYRDACGWCPRLETFEYSTSHSVEDLTTLIPGLTGLGVMGYVLARNGAFEILRTYVDRLTTLKIHGSLTRVHPLLEGGDALHDYLCDAPLLLHLYAPNARLYLDRFDLKHHFTLTAGRYVDSRIDTVETLKEGQKYNRPHAQKIWACRDLKTLQVIFSCRQTDAGTEESSRLLFGYLSRVAPKLEDLIFEKESLVLQLRGGLCLLQRMHRLKKLVMATKSTQEWTDQDFAWLENTLSVRVKQTIKMTSFLAGFEAEEGISRERNPWSLDATIKSEMNSGDDRGIAGRYVYDGVDMKNVGLLNDLVDVYKEKEAGKWTCWPEMERFELVRLRWAAGSNMDLNRIIERHRPDIRVQCYHAY